MGRIEKSDSGSTESETTEFFRQSGSVRNTVYKNLKRYLLAKSHLELWNEVI